MKDDRGKSAVITFEDFKRLEAKIDAIMDHLGIGVNACRSAKEINEAIKQRLAELERRQQRKNRKK